MALNKINQLSSSSTSGKIPTQIQTKAPTTVEILGNQLVINQTIPVPPPKQTFYTSKLLNYVEPFNINGMVKTAFYSEFSTNFQIGDRVFILDGFYDSDDYIQQDKYTKFTDGYRVLGIEGCKIILDIDYTGQLPYTDFKLEDLIFVHNITSQEKFNLVNSMYMGLSFSTTTQNYSSPSLKKLFSSFSGFKRLNVANIFGGNILRVDSSVNLLGSTDLSAPSGPINNPGFYIKSSNDNWSDITTQFDRNRVRLYDTINNPRGLIGNKKIYILGEDFVYKGITYRERNVYRYSTTQKDWIFDKTYKQPVISKTNFRSGIFNGAHQDGAFGTYDKSIDFKNATWNNGFFVNSKWVSGRMDSKSKKGEQNYLASLDVDANGNRIVQQNLDTSNNRNFGYNYVIDSTIENSTISNGTFENSNIGSTGSQPISALDNYYNNSATFSVIINNGKFNFCDVFYTSIIRGNVSDSILNNVVLKGSKSISNQLIDSVATQVDYNSDGGLTILGADLYSYYLTQNQDTIGDYTDIRGVLKLFISDKDFLRMEKGDSFYLEKINKDFFVSSLNTSDKIILPIETRYMLDYYFDAEKISDGTKISVSLKNKNENRYKHYVKLGKIKQFVEYYIPTTSLPYWNDPATAIGRTQFQEPVEWNYFSQFYFEYQTVLYTSNGLTKLYYYLGDDSTGPGNSVQLITDPTDASQGGPGLNGVWWQEVGVWKGEWLDEQDINPLPNEIYTYFDASNSTTYYLVRTSFVGDGYRLSYDVETGSIDQRQLIVKDSGYDSCSIDLNSTLFGFYENYGGQLVLNQSTDNLLQKLPLNRINDIFANNYIKPADFRSGLFVDSTWVSGYNVNYYQNIISKRDPYNLEISFSKPHTLKVRTQNLPFDTSKPRLGYDIKTGDYVWLNGVYYQTDQEFIDLSDRYLVVEGPTLVNADTQIDYKIQAVGISFSYLSMVSATFSVYKAEDSNYSTLSKFSLQKSSVKSGLFVRTNLDSVVFNNPEFNNQDINFTPSNLNRMRFVNILSSNNKLTFENGVHLNSHISNPNFVNGLVHESIWNSGTFSIGIFSSGYWKDGTFKEGLFLDSRDTTASTLKYNSTPLIKSWMGGKFLKGRFINSVWLDGFFNNGLFNNSDFYGGIWNNGILGSAQTPMNKTTFGHYSKLPNIGATCAIWYNGTVDNAIMGGDGVVYWYNGRYNSGEFTSYGSSETKESIWFNGEFNGSKFTHLARWKNGRFNNGKFWSYYGWDKVGPTNSSNLITDFGWESGTFISGEFGNKGMTANSVWYGGQFSDGTFQGRFWNNGYFLKGKFFGSGVISPTPSNVSAIGEYDFANSYTYEYYGLWKDGQVVDNELRAQPDQAFSINKKRSQDQLIYFVDSSRFENMLWMNGTFSHNDGVMENSLFLAGNFVNGDFNGGIFNPYVDRDFTGTFSNASFGNSALWSSGNFLGGSFYASEWYKGNFYNGYMSGAKWNDGTWFYGNADNILWLDGTWKNGNWNGSPFDYTLISSTASYLQLESGDFGTISRFIMNDGREKDIIYKVSDFNTGNNYLHTLNVFSQSNIQVLKADGFTNSRGWTQSQEFYTGIKRIQIGISPWPTSRPIYADQPTLLKNSYFILFPTIELVREKEVAGLVLSDGTISQSTKPKVDTQTNKVTVTINDSNLTTFGGEISYNTPPKLVSGYNKTGYASLNTAPSGKLTAVHLGTINIFTQSSTTYTVKVTVAVELTPTVDVQIYCGKLGYSTFKLESDKYIYSVPRTATTYDRYEDYYPKIYTITSVYTTTTETVSTQAGKVYFLRKASDGILRLLKCEITATKKEYNLESNNKILKSINLFPNTNAIDFFTSSVVLSTPSDNGKEVGINFGNGIFKRGIWENGVWNNGYRSGGEEDGWNQDGVGFDDVIKCFDILRSETYAIAPKTWKVTFSVATANLSELDINKKVSIGNIVGIDANGRRKLFRDPIQISSFDINTMKLVVIIVSDFQLKEIKRDSTNHLIYVTQNIWLNGVFLNGYFRGVWNNGLMKGSPRLTEMGETHFIDGVIDGGHFISQVAYDDENRIFYNNSLIQNMTFFSNDLGTYSRPQYLSWIDAPYSTQSYVNINSEAKEWSDNPAQLKSDLDSVSYTQNIDGYPVLDVLSSTSYFRDRLSETVRKYSLGTRPTKSTNLIPNQGRFLDTFDPSISKIGLKAFTDRGWTWSFLGLPLGSVWDSERIGYKLIFESNTTSVNSKILRIYASQSLSPGAATYDDRYGVLLNNTKVVTKPNRYYQTEIKLVKNPTSRINNITHSVINMNANKANLNLPRGDSFNHVEVNSLNKVEYFYNKLGLDLWIYNKSNEGLATSKPPYDTQIENISFFEVDMIPFFSYATSSGSIDLSLKSPYVGVAPVIDYTNNNFDFVDNVDLGIDYRVMNTQNSVSLSQNIKGTSVPVEYQFQLEDLNNQFDPEPFEPPGGLGGGDFLD